MRARGLLGAAVTGAVLGACTLVGAPERSAPAPPPVAAPPDAEPPASTEGPTSGACDATRGQQVVQLMNQQRDRRGVGPLAVDARLVAAARAHALDLARGGADGHRGSDGSAPADRAQRAGYAWLLVGENVARGIASASTAMAGWMDSPSHRDNVLDAGYRDVGVAYIDAPDTRYRTYWVVVFGAPAGGDATRLRCNP